MRGPARTSTSESSDLKWHTRCVRMARMNWYSQMDASVVLLFWVGFLGGRASGCQSEETPSAARKKRLAAAKNTDIVQTRTDGELLAGHRLNVDAPPDGLEHGPQALC